jgi:hypothetical protein
MIKFFRKIRQNLLMENKTGKYFKYAIGEIVLVVIGILIALQINNWNENRIDRKQERVLLVQLKSEFESNLNQLDQKIALRKDMIKASIKLLNCIDYQENCNSEDILKNIGFSILAPTFDPIVNDITSSGRIVLLQSADLKQKLSLWTSEIIQVTEEEQMWTHYRSNEFVPFLLEFGIHRTLVNNFWNNSTAKSFQLDKKSENDFEIGNSKKKIDFSILLSDSKFESLVAQSASFSKLANSQSISLRSRIVEILEIINNDLNK